MQTYAELNASPQADGGENASAATDHLAIERLQIQLSQLAALTELVARIESFDEAKAACREIAEQLKTYLSADRVLIGLCDRGSIACSLTAVSGMNRFQPRSDFALASEAAMQECVARNDVVFWPPRSDSDSAGLLAHRQFARSSETQAIATYPLFDAAGSLQGVWMVVGSPERVHDDQVNRFLAVAQQPVASALGLITRAQRGPMFAFAATAYRYATDRRGRFLLLGAALILMAMCVPVSYQAKCDCFVEPVARRFVAAPFTGPLEKALVRPGDVVDAGQLLARMDGRELRLELSGMRAELHRAMKQRAGHLATLDSGQAAIATLEVSRLEARIGLLEHRQSSVEICSPVAGIVVSGDHHDAEDMPLEKGQPLFEVASLDKMEVELAIHEDDYPYVRPGMPVTIRLDAFPLRSFEAAIDSIHPRTELRDDENVFIAEVKLVESVKALRPGMHGTAHVKSDRFPLGWNLFRRPATALLAWLGW